MANDSGSATKISGVVLIIIGIGLALWSYQLSGSVGSEITHAITGSETDKVMALYIGGAISFVVGVFRLFK